MVTLVSALTSPLNEAVGFRALLNSFLPRKRAICQMLIRDHDGRVLLCPHVQEGLGPPRWSRRGRRVAAAAVTRELAEELALTVPAGPLLLTDWLPPWAAGTTRSASSSTAVSTTRAARES